jgi:hypothetical protein
MKRFCWVVVVLLSVSGCLIAQELPKAEIFGGYSFAPASVSGSTTLNVNGWNAAATGNINRLLGITVDFSQHFGTSSSSTDYQFRSFLVGPQFTYRKREKVTPFAHVLVGDARFGSRLNPDVLNLRYHENCLALAAGGGVDVHLYSIVAVRLIQVDYYITSFSKDRQNDLRLGFGIVLKFGQRR